jgi:hypothetical protein
MRWFGRMFGGATDEKIPATAAGMSGSRIPAHLRGRFDYLNSLQPSSPPHPWTARGVIGVGGLLAVGFAEASDLLLILSANGWGVLDCQAGKWLTGDDELGSDVQPGTFDAEGVGPLAGQSIRLAGPWGGGLLRWTYDRWSIEQNPVSWPDDELFLCPPGEHLYQGDNLTKIAVLPSELRAFGFSPTGRCLVVATASDVTMFARE